MDLSVARFIKKVVIKLRVVNRLGSVGKIKTQKRINVVFKIFSLSLG